MTNAALADRFELLAQLLDIHGENPFKTKSYANAAFTLERLPKEVSAMQADEFHQIRGFGDAIIAKINELQTTGALSLLEKTIAATPPGVLEMLRIKGLGPKKIAIIWKELGIETIGELEYACIENRLAAVKGFGRKTQEKICESIRFYQNSLGFHLYAAMEAPAKDLILRLQNTIPNARFELTGAIRRQEDTIAGIELVTDAGIAALCPFFEKFEGTEITVTDAALTVKLEGTPDIICHLANPENFYERLFITTASEDYLQEYKAQHSISATAAREVAIFEAAGLPFIPPPLRATAALQLQTEPLIQPGDIRGIIHSHTDYSDGAETLETMAKAARDAGFEYIVISDHSQAAYYADGLKPDKIAEQHREIEALNKKMAPFRIFKSIEADILGDGELDYDAAVLSTFDLVIASVHSNIFMNEEQAMNRILTAVRNPFTHILGHPTARLLLSRPGYPVDHKKLIDTCAAHDVVIEINANPRRLDIDWRWIPYAMQKGVLLSINPDAHSIKGMGDVRYGVLSAQKGGLTADKNLSSFSLSEFEAWLQTKRF